MSIKGRTDAPASIMGGVLYVDPPDTRRVTVRNTRDGKSRDVFLDGVLMGKAEVVTKAFGTSRYTYLFRQGDKATGVAFKTMGALKLYVVGLKEKPHA